MKQTFCFLFLTLVAVSCGTRGNQFKIDGKLLHLNQGEFYIYSPDGSAVDGIDTIKVEGGRFSYEMACQDPATLLLVFPNFSEQPIFAEPGAAVEIKADASHLKQLKVTGTDDNELMNQFREEIENASPPEEVIRAAQFIRDHAGSAVGVYLLRKYFVANERPDYTSALQLAKLLQAAQPKNGQLVRLIQQLEPLSAAAVGNRLPAFSAVDVNGAAVSRSALAAAPVAVVSSWASWSYDSENMQRMLHRMQKRSGGRLKLLSISADAGKYECRMAMKRDSITWPVVCDGQLLDGRLMRSFGLYAVPDNVVLQNGRITQRGLTTEKLEEHLAKLF